MSLESQKAELRRLAAKEGLRVVEEFEEARSSKLPGRPVFNEMLDDIEAGHGNGILCWDVDRLYRNPIDEGRTRWLLQRGIIRSIRTPSRDFFPEDAGLLMGVEGGRATDYIIRLAKNVKRGTDEKVRRGEWPGKKPLGYIYDSRLRNIVPDPKAAPVVRTLFEEYADGIHSLDSAARRLFALGVRSRSGAQWSDSAVHHFLSNILYVGLMNWCGETFEGKYKPLISMELFKRVKDALKKRSKPRRTRASHRFPFCGVFHCSCGGMITAQFGKGHGGIYRYCRCTRKVTPCKEKYVQEDEVARQCFEKLRPLGVSGDEAASLLAAIEVESSKGAATLQGEVKALEQRQAPLQAKLDRLTHGYLDQLIDEDSYRVAKEEILIEKTELKRELCRLRRTHTSCWIEPAKEVVNRLKTMGNDSFATSPTEMAGLIQKIGLNPQISAKTVTFSLAAPYDSIASLLDSARFARGAVAHPLDPVGVPSTTWCAVQGSNL